MMANNNSSSPYDRRNAEMSPNSANRIFAGPEKRFRSLDPALMEQIAKKVSEQFPNDNYSANAELEMELPEELPKEEKPLDYSLIRTVKGLFNVWTASSRSPPEILEEIIQALNKNKVEYQTHNFIFNCKWISPILDDGHQGIVLFTIELCKIQRSRSGPVAAANKFESKRDPQQHEQVFW